MGDSIPSHAPAQGATLVAAAVVIVTLLLTLAFARPPAPMLQVAFAARAFQPGEFVAVEVRMALPADAVHVYAFGSEWPAFPASEDRRTFRVLGGIDLDVVPGEYTVDVRADGSLATLRDRRVLTVQPKTFRTRTLTVDDAYVNPPAEVAARIAEEAKALDRLWRERPVRPLANGGWRPPVPEQANSAFGTRSIFNGEPRSPHSGADFPTPPGSPVRAPAGGRVALARDLYFTGATVILDHGGGVLSLFAHLSAIDVSHGAEVAAGTVLGTVGATGRVTGPHLHWAVRAAGARVDPLSVLHLLGGS